ncbi:hypothetical protein PUN71_019000 [Arthrobacter sp. NQ7]|uniref:DUF6804 family protein n=1 Tax=Arthrobacter sp. NQ7 TaxID=3032303 RepID=UPI00240F2C8C|nr:DUF6804 family protein [Arthrobacter sp. NQ7]MDJ0459297.1 hypothetical protein [Arthrobacter sp. NQ7]
MDEDAIIDAAWQAALRQVPATVTTYTTTMNIRSRVKRVLILAVNDSVGWVWVHEGRAFWGAGSVISGKTNVMNCFAGSVDTNFAVLSSLVAEWYLWVRPPQGTPMAAPRDVAREFVRALENGMTPPTVNRLVRPAAPSPAGTAPAGQPRGAAPAGSHPSFHANPHPPRAGRAETDLNDVRMVTAHPATIPAVVGGFFLLVAILGAPYSFYEVVRWAVTGMAVWSAIVAGGQQRTGWMVAFIATVLLFNPLIPVYLTRESWVPLDVAAMVLFISGAVKLEESHPAPR